MRVEVVKVQRKKNSTEKQDHDQTKSRLIKFQTDSPGWSGPTSLALGPDT
jgi:hypothetical protein